MNRALMIAAAAIAVVGPFLIFGVEWDGPPSRTVEICDATRTRMVPIMMPRHIGGVTTMVTHIVPVTDCVRSHVEPNPAYARWREQHSEVIDE